jgi:DNA modification methylase
VSEITVPPVTFVPVESLRVDGQNPNRMTEKQTDALCESINKYGFIVPIITNKDLLVADGEQRLQAAQKLSMKSVPIIRLNISDVDRRILRQVLNKLRGEHELLADAREFDLIVKAGQEDDLKNLLLLKDAEIERYLREIREPKEETYEILEIEKIQTDIKRGDVYQLGAHRLMCGDATNKEDIQKLFNLAKADMVFNDPPYGIDYIPEERPIGGRARSVTKLGGITADKHGEFNQEDWLRHLPLYCKGAFYICASTNIYSPLWKHSLEITKREPTVIVWNKNNHSIGRRDYHRKHEFIFYNWFKDKYWSGTRSEVDVWNCDRENPTEYIHPTQKPVELIVRAIINSCPKNGITADLFGGSGSTLIACEQTGRICFMMEIDPRYCQVIINRWEKYTGKKAVKLKETERNDITKTAVSA